MHPVAQGLAIHAADLGRLAAIDSVANCRKRRSRLGPRLTSLERLASVQLANSRRNFTAAGMRRTPRPTDLSIAPISSSPRSGPSFSATASDPAQFEM